MNDNTKIILQTQRLYLRELSSADFPALCRIMQDEKTMYAYEGPFSDKEVQDWLENQFKHYSKYGFGKINRRFISTKRRFILSFRCEDFLLLLFDCFKYQMVHRIWL